MGKPGNHKGDEQDEDKVLDEETPVADADDWMDDEDDDPMEDNSLEIDDEEI